MYHYKVRKNLSNSILEIPYTICCHHSTGLIQKKITKKMHTFLKNIDIILASQSPRRKDILNQLGITDFQQIVSPFDEDTGSG